MLEQCRHNNDKFHVPGCIPLDKSAFSKDRISCQLFCCTQHFLIIQLYQNSWTAAEYLPSTAPLKNHPYGEGTLAECLSLRAWRKQHTKCAGVARRNLLVLINHISYKTVVQVPEKKIECTHTPYTAVLHVWRKKSNGAHIPYNRTGCARGSLLVGLTEEVKPTPKLRNMCKNICFSKSEEMQNKC